MAAAQAVAVRRLGVAQAEVHRAGRLNEDEFVVESHLAHAEETLDEARADLDEVAMEQPPTWRNGSTRCPGSGSRWSPRDSSSSSCSRSPPSSSWRASPSRPSPVARTRTARRSRTSAPAAGTRTPRRTSPVRRCPDRRDLAVGRFDLRVTGWRAQRVGTVGVDTDGDTDTDTDTDPRAVAGGISDGVGHGALVAHDKPAAYESSVDVFTCCNPMTPGVRGRVALGTPPGRGSALTPLTRCRRSPTESSDGPRPPRLEEASMRNTITSAAGLMALGALLAAAPGAAAPPPPPARASGRPLPHTDLTQRALRRWSRRRVRSV